MKAPRFVWLAALVLACPVDLQAQPAASPSAPLVRLGEHEVSELDFRAHLQRLPEAARKLADASPERNRSAVEGLLISRVLSARAREQGLDRDPILQKRLELQAESLLAAEYLAKRRREITPPADFSARARELYLTTMDRYRTPEQVHIQQVLISLAARTPAMALEIAQQVRARAQAGEDFMALAKELSEDPGRARHGGDLGFVSEKDIRPELWAVAAKSLKDGELSEPVSTRLGYYILRRVAYRKAEQLPFEAVRAQIEDAEREKFVNAAMEGMTLDIRNSSKLEWNDEGLRSLTRVLAPEEVRRLNEETLREQRSGSGRPQR